MTIPNIWKIYGKSKNSCSKAPSSNSCVLTWIRQSQGNSSGSQLTSGGPKKLAELGSCNSIISGMIDIRSFSLVLLDVEIQQYDGIWWDMMGYEGIWTYEPTEPREEYGSWVRENWFEGSTNNNSDTWLAQKLAVSGGSWWCPVLVTIQSYKTIWMNKQIDKLAINPTLRTFPVFKVRLAASGVPPIHSDRSLMERSSTFIVTRAVTLWSKFTSAWHKIASFIDTVINTKMKPSKISPAKFITALDYKILEDNPGKPSNELSSSNRIGMYKLASYHWRGLVIKKRKHVDQLATSPQPKQVANLPITSFQPLGDPQACNAGYLQGLWARFEMKMFTMLAA